MEPEDAPVSQASSHFRVEPVSAAVLADGEVQRRDALRALGHCRTGCRDLDDYVLLGGLERGSVVGLSTEDEELGVLLGMQLLAHTLCGGTSLSSSTPPSSPLPDTRPPPQRALIITPKPASTVLGTLRTAVARELADRRVAAGLVRDQMRSCLDRTMLSCVFDLDGLWEVLADLDRPTEEDDGDEDEDEGVALPPITSQPVAPSTLSSSPLSSPPPSSALGSPPDFDMPSSPPSGPSAVLEIQDSQSEEDDLSSPSPSITLPPARLPPSSPHPTLPETAAPPLPNIEVQQSPSGETTVPKPRLRTAKTAAIKQPLPDIILVTHFSSLLTGLFTHRDKPAAHTALQLLGSHMRYLSRNLSSNPLIVLLNSTATSSSSADAGPGAPSVSGPAAATSSSRPDARPLDPTLSSVFNPPSLPLGGQHYAVGQGAARRNKPRFGLIFTQLLDVHLLGTQVPRGKDDADIVFAPLPSGHDEDARGVLEPRFVTVVEVLLDEMGVWEGKTGARKSREQRWTAVDVVEGRVVDAFAKRATTTSPPKEAPAEIRLVAGFGGPRV